MTLPATVPSVDWSSWSGLDNLLRQKYRTVRALTDPVLPGAAIASWMYSPAGTLSYAAISGGNGFDVPSLTTAASSGAAATLRVANAAGGTAQMQITPSSVGALALTMEGLRLGGSGGYDFQIGFPGNTSTVGGCSFWQLNGQSLGEIDTYSSGGAASRTPRSVSDAVTTANSMTLTSATAAFTSSDAGQPAGAAGTILIPGTVIAAVVSATQVTLSLPALVSGSGQALTIGQQPNVNVTSGVFSYMNLSFVWWTQDGFAWILQDDQVLAEINVAAAANYTTTPAVLAQVQIISRDGAAHAMTWDQARFSIAGNGN